MSSRRVALDTNLLVLFVVGRLDPRLIAVHKRLRAFAQDDFRLLDAHVADAELVTIPNTMTEASNLVAQGFTAPARAELFNALKKFSGIASERYVPSAAAASQTEYAWLGLTDSAWLSCLDRVTEFVTVDLQLFIAAENRGLRATNFNHLRDAPEE